MHLPAFLNSYFEGWDPEEVRHLLTSPKVINVTQGCSVGCDFCAMAASKSVRVMPWPWVVEIANRVWSLETEETHNIPWVGGIKTIQQKRHTINSLFFDSDPLKDYYDAAFDKDFFDVYTLFNPTFISTAGFEMGSIGERAAQKLRNYFDERWPSFDGIRVSFSLESRWARELGDKAYISHMKNVFQVLQPNEITILTTNQNRAATLQAFTRAFGRLAGEVPGAKVCRPHFEGLAKVNLDPAEAYYQTDGSVCCIDAYVLNPNRGVVYVARNEQNGQMDYRRVNFNQMIKSEKHKELL